MGVLGRVKLRRDRTSRDHVRVLVQGMNYAPEPIGVAKYTTELVTFLGARGHEVEVIAALPHYPGFVLRDGCASLYARTRMNRIGITRCPLLLRNGGRGIWRLVAPLSFAITSAPVMLWRALRQVPDVILCVEPTLFAAPAAILAAWLTGARLVLHVQDLEVDAAFAMAHLRGCALRTVALAVERLLLRRFDGIVTISDAMRDRLVAKGLTRDHVQVIRNWVVPASLRPSEPVDAIRARFGIGTDERVVLYAGHLGSKQGIPTLIDAARLLARRPDVRVVIVGEGPMAADVDRAAAALPNLTRLPLQPAARLGDTLAMADIHVLPQDANAADLVFPSKLGPILASGRPVVVTANPGTELAMWLDGAATLVCAGDAALLAASLEQDLGGVTAARQDRAAALAATLDAAVLLPQIERILRDAGLRRSAVLAEPALESLAWLPPDKPVEPTLAGLTG